uniref:Ribosomal protein S7 n=1 Tax=Strombidium sp. TaxID=181122 RepID=A0A7T0M4J5_9SPIT|nr:ribosomal protein S7 [Strombidium sp.]
MNMKYKNLFLNSKYNINMSNKTIFYFIDDNKYKSNLLWPNLYTKTYSIYYNLWLTENLTLLEDKLLFDIITNKYGEGEPNNNYKYLQENKFLDFFKSHRIDTPTCFRKTKSIRRNNNKFELIKFNNYLMRKGKRWQFMKMFLTIMMNLFHKYYFFFYKNKKNFNCRNLFFFYNNLFYVNNNYYNLKFNKPLNLLFNTSIYEYEKHYNPNFYIKFFLLLNLKKITPVFMYYIYKVAKLIYKNTRGKSGKYTYIWKYVSPYKRTNLIMYWIIKETKSRPGRTLYDRVYAVLKDLIFQPKSLLIYKIKRFSNIYVYKYNRNTLAETFITSTK